MYLEEASCENGVKKFVCMQYPQLVVYLPVEVCYGVNNMAIPEVLLLGDDQQTAVAKMYTTEGKAYVQELPTPAVLS